MQKTTCNAEVPSSLGGEDPLENVRDLIFLSREGRDLGVAFQAAPGSQASSRGEAKDSALLSSMK